MKIYGHASLQRELWTDEEWEIFEQFHFKCVRCSAPAVTLHEIHPRSKRPKDWMTPENRIPVCHKCHQTIHRYGTRIYAGILIVLRKERLKEYART